MFPRLEASSKSWKHLWTSTSLLLYHRITEWVRLEKLLGSLSPSFYQTFCQWALSAMSIVPLNTFRDGNSTSSLGTLVWSPFQIRLIFTYFFSPWYKYIEWKKNTTTNNKITIIKTQGKKKNNQKNPIMVLTHI